MSLHPTEGNPDTAFPIHQPSSESRPESHLPPPNPTGVPLATSGEGNELEAQPKQAIGSTLLPYLARDACFLSTDTETSRQNLNLNQDSSSLTKVTREGEKKRKG